MTPDPAVAPRMLVVLPAAPLLLPLGRSVPADVTAVLAACDAVLAGSAPAAAEVVIVASPDRLRDLAGGTAAPVAWDVADHLLDRAGHRGARTRHLAGQWRAPDGAVAVVMADGSAAARDPGGPRSTAVAAEFDARLSGALRTGDLAALRTVTDTEAARVGCTTAAAWRAVGDQLGTSGWTCRDVWSGQPFGVTYFTAALHPVG